MKHAPGPWRACNKGKCVCGQIWSETADFPVATVTIGKWGDEYPALRIVDGESLTAIGARIEAYNAMIEYGEVSREMAEANARLIAASPTMYEYIQRKALEGDKDAAEIIANINE